MKNYKELNEYILDYLENDRTHSAIMLTGSWGSGKSFYIKNSLVPALRKNNQNRCIVVSLHGIKSTLEIGKEIYLELRAKWLQSDNEILQTGKNVAKTVVKGITSFFNIDVNSSDEELQKMYESVNLSDKLIVLEDAERSLINITELLGYINRLTEQDGVKILVVANEDAFVTYSLGKVGKDGEREKIYTKAAIDYLSAKEKTIGDTIIFQCELSDAIENIISSFKNEKLSFFANKKSIDSIISLLFLFECNNLRTFIYACQKTVDIYRKIEKIQDINNAPSDCWENIFFSIIILSIHIKEGRFPEWKGTEHLSTELSIGAYPLYRFCYDYIRWQMFDNGKVEDAFEEHKEMKLYSTGNHKEDKDMLVLASFHICTEIEVRNALNNIENRLLDENDIPFYEYGKLAVWLIELNSVLDYDYSVCKSRMMQNLRGKARIINGELLFLTSSDEFDKLQKEQYDSFKKDIQGALNESVEITFVFSYNPGDIKEFARTIMKERYEEKNENVFFARFDLEKLINMLIQCSAEEISEFRNILWHVYRRGKKENFADKERKALSVFLDMLEAAKSSVPADRIIKLQYGYLIDNIARHIHQIE